MISFVQNVCSKWVMRGAVGWALRMCGTKCVLYGLFKVLQ